MNSRQQALMFYVNSGEYSILSSFVLRQQTNNYASLSTKTKLSEKAKYIGLINQQVGFTLGKMENDQVSLITNVSHWVTLDSPGDISFMTVPALNRLYFTVTYSSGTQLYFVPLSCSQEQHSTEIQNDDGSCQCDEGYGWDTQILECIFIDSDCSLDSGSTGLYLTVINECQCKIDFFWHKETQKCLPNCLTALSREVNPANSSQCLCRSPAVWNDDISSCYLECQNIAFSTGQHESLTVCACFESTYWNESSLACTLNCSSIVATISPSADGSSCVCEDNHNWVPSERKCLRNCAADENWNGEFNRDGSCGCLSGSKWDYVLEKCVSLDCSLFEYTTGDKDAAGECICEEFFAWDSRVKKCIVQCKDIKDGGDSLGTGQNLDAHSCACIEGVAWSSTAARCTRVCSEVPFSTGMNIDTENCHCIVAYEWNPVTVSCQISCGSRIGELAEYDDTERHCVCDPTAYYWSQINSACYRDCYLKPFAYPDDGPNPDACNCFLKYEWDAVAKNCVLSCSGSFDTGVSTDGTQCTCQTNSFWSRNAKTCVVDCNKDLLSTKRFIYDRCECKANSQWSDVTNKCECILGYVFVASTEYCEMQGGSGATISISIAGGALISGPLVFAGMKFLERKKKEDKKKKENEKIEEVMASEKEIVTLRNPNI